MANEFEKGMLHIITPSVVRSPHFCRMILEIHPSSAHPVHKKGRIGLIDGLRDYCTACGQF